MKKKPHAPAAVVGLPIKDIPIHEIMTRDLATVAPTATVRRAAELMRDHDVGMLPVLNRGRVVGLITDRDLVVRAIAEGRTPGRAKVRDLMTTTVAFCYEDEDVSRAISSMGQRKVRRMLVLNHEEKLVGVLSIGDVAMDAGSRDLAGSALRSVSHPARASA